MSSSSSSLRYRRGVRAGISNRNDFPLQPECTALIIIDIQKYLSPPTPTTTTTSSVSSSRNDKNNNKNNDDDNNDNEMSSSLSSSYYINESFPKALKNIQRLLHTFRTIRDTNSRHNNTNNDNNDNDNNNDNDKVEDKDNNIHNNNNEISCCTSGSEVIFTYIQSLTNDGRDISLDYKVSGPKFTEIPNINTSIDDLFLEECKPASAAGKGDICIPKTSCSVVLSTNIDYVLRNLHIEQIVIVGQLTDQCIESAVRCFADIGYLITVGIDACIAQTLDCHNKGIHGMKGFARILNTDQIIQEMKINNRK